MDQSQWHAKIADMLRKRVIEQLLTYEKDLRKQHKTCAVPVEKAFSVYIDSITAMFKVRAAIVL